MLDEPDEFDINLYHRRAAESAEGRPLLRVSQGMVKEAMKDKSGHIT
ncbi:MAG: hypothetical protein ABII26_07865 [Pseudomonadota bacterium]